jgi:hypothetical protein
MKTKDFLNSVNLKTVHAGTKYDLEYTDDMAKLLEDYHQAQLKLLGISGVSKSLPTEDCVRDWWRQGTGDKYFWKHETDWTNEQVFREIYQALTYFINRWQ